MLADQRLPDMLPPAVGSRTGPQRAPVFPVSLGCGSGTGFPGYR